MLFKSLSGKSRFMKKLFFLSFLSLASFCLSASPVQAEEQGEIYGWGSIKFLNGQTLTNISKIAAGGHHNLVLKSDGSIVGWGDNSSGQATPPDGNDFIAIAAGTYHSLALKSDGSIAGWGGNRYGQATPPDGNNFIAIAAGVNHNLALKSDDSIVGWGWDSSGQATPPDGNDFIAIAAGFRHSLALKSDGSIVGWGRDSDGQATPPDGNDFIAIAAGREHSLALKSDGSIVGWGRDDEGQATLPEGNDFIAIAAGEYHSLALKSDGSIVGWGSNFNEFGEYYGQATPPDGNDFIAIAAGAWHGLALKSDGSIVGWGANHADQSIPPDGNDFIAIAAGGSQSLALKRVPQPIEVPMKFTPQKLNPNSKGKWVKAHFILPDGYTVGDVDVNTPAKIEPSSIVSDYLNVFINEDGFVKVEAAFARTAFCSIVIGDTPVDVRVTGSFTNGQQFYGTDTVRITANNLEYLGSLLSYWLEAGCGKPDWCGGADLDQDTAVDLIDFALFNGCCIEVVRE